MIEYLDVIVNGGPYRVRVVAGVPVRVMRPTMRYSRGGIPHQTWADLPNDDILTIERAMAAADEMLAKKSR